MAVAFHLIDYLSIFYTDHLHSCKLNIWGVYLSLNDQRLNGLHIFVQIIDDKYKMKEYFPFGQFVKLLSFGSDL
jgi:hypothetical protein